eukprot:3065699-Rhodomonas_salina.2
MHLRKVFAGSWGGPRRSSMRDPMNCSCLHSLRASARTAPSFCSDGSDAAAHFASANNRTSRPTACTPA